MKFFDWNDEKNKMLKKMRGVSFEQVELAIASGDLVDRIKHPIEDNEKIFLKTIIPNSKATKKYLGGKK